MTPLAEPLLQVERRHLTPAEDKQIMNELKAQRQQEVLQQANRSIKRASRVLTKEEKLADVLYNLPEESLTREEQLANVLYNLPEESLTREEQLADVLYNLPHDIKKDIVDYEQATQQFSQEIAPEDYEEFLVGQYDDLFIRSVGQKILPILGKIQLVYPNLTKNDLLNIADNLLATSLNKISDYILAKGVNPVLIQPEDITGREYIEI